jgi:hypothetical protein
MNIENGIFCAVVLHLWMQRTFLTVADVTFRCDVIETGDKLVGLVLQFAPQLRQQEVGGERLGPKPHLNTHQ